MCVTLPYSLLLALAFSGLMYIVGIYTYVVAKQEQLQDGLSKFVDEAKRLGKFQNEPGIVRIFDSFTDNDTAYIIMEYLDGETLTERLKRIYGC